MLTINSYNKGTLDRSSKTIVDRYKGIVSDKARDINDVKTLTMMLYQTIYYYLYDAKETLKQISEVIDSWEDETGIDTTPIREEIKHTEAMVEAVEEITDSDYGEEEDTKAEEKTEAVERETEEVVEAIKVTPEVKEEVKEEVRTEITPSTPSTPTTPSTPSAPATPEEAKENARQEAADSIRGRADDNPDFTFREDERTGFDRIMDVLTGGPIIPSTPTEDRAEGARAEALDIAATVIENGGTAREAVQAYVDAINPPTEEDKGYITAPATYSPTDETAQTINEDIQAIIDAANEAANADSGGSDTPSCDEPSCDTPPCDTEPCDCCDSDTCDDSCCVADTPEPCSGDICVQD